MCDEVGRMKGGICTYIIMIAWRAHVLSTAHAHMHLRMPCGDPSYYVHGESLYEWRQATPATTRLPPPPCAFLLDRGNACSNCNPHTNMRLCMIATEQLWKRQTLRTIQFCAEVHNVAHMARCTGPAEIGAGQRAAGRPASNINRALSRN